ncbi:MAG: nuclear transport factor 2 family protein [Sphingobium sp.]|nr:nuclear transport factor 2 family protein [Sphingobium sp.]
MHSLAKGARRVIGLSAMGVGMVLAAPGSTQPAQTTMATLLDRIQIEDLITSYYGNLGGNGHSFSDYYTDDATFDLCGKIYMGKAGIDQSYKDLGATQPLPKGTFHMLLTNPEISVTGDTATAKFIWTGIINEQVKAPPRFVEQGREYDRLVKRNGQWRITKRVVIADSGLPDFCDASHTPRKDYDLSKDK